MEKCVIFANNNLKLTRDMDFGDLLFVIAFSIGIILIAYKLIQKFRMKRLEKQRIEEQAESMRILDEAHKQVVDTYELLKEKTEEQYGKADNTIIIEEYSINHEIRAYSERKQVFIMGEMYDFEQILNVKAEKSLTENMILITLKDIKNPLLTINLGRDLLKCEQILALFNVIKSQ